MMKRTLKQILLAVTIGLLISSGLYLSNERRASAKAVPIAKLLVVKERVPANTLISAEQFVVESRPVQYIPAGAISAPETAVGRQAKWELSPGDPITEEKLAKPGEEAIVLPIPKGKRAVTVKVDEVVGVAGFIQPNSIVDVIATWDVEGTPHSKVILQKLQVLAVAQESSRSDDPKAKITSSVTLAVSPSEAEKVILSTERGSIRLAMRSPDETTEAKTSGITPISLTGAKPKPKPARTAPRAPAPKVQAALPEPDPILIIRGTNPNKIESER